MKLYHGTSLDCWNRIRTEGIVPRGIHKRKTNWKHTIESNPRTVYLSDGYAQYFSHAASRFDGKAAKAKGVLIEIDTDLLDPSKFCADEDALEQAMRGRDALPESYDMIRRTRYYRKLAYDRRGEQSLWDDSLKVLGTCGYAGTIPVSAITRIAVLDFTHKPLAWLSLLDNSVSTQSWRFLKDRHRGVLQWIMDGIPLDEGVGAALLGVPTSATDPVFVKMREQFKEIYGTLRQEAVRIVAPDAVI